MELLKKQPFYKPKKITNKQQLYNAPLLKAAFPALHNFFIYELITHEAASEILLVFLSFFRHFVFKTISVWVRSKGILISKI
jgi:hypothetical protein